MAVQLVHTLCNVMQTAPRTERKFYVQPERVGLAYGILRQICRPDPQFASGEITSLYFDTQDLEEHNRSISGVFRKDKVRIRWYDVDERSNGTRSAFLEWKAKEGFVGTKRRLRMDVPAERLTPSLLAQGIIPWAQMSDTLSAFGYFPTDMLSPVVRITYRRRRFVEPLTGQRVALDYRIRSTMVRPIPGNGEKDLELAGGVIEIKGTTIELPVTLRKMGMLDVDWSRFSKYSACIEAHEEDPGSQGRFSPSGRIV